jgi:hypothetical protein
MIRYTPQSQIDHQLFKTPFQQKLSKDNRWVRLSKILPWDKMASVFMERLSDENGRKTIDLRIVMGAMFIQYYLNLTDREVLEVITENVYMQYFVGLSTFQTEPIFDHSLLTIMRKRLGHDGSKQLNELFLEHAIEKGLVKHRKPKSVEKGEDQTKEEDDIGDTGGVSDQDKVEITEAKKEATNKGTLKVDATVAPQDISYPTDTGLLNKARELSEQIIDHLFDQCRDLLEVKPRTYRREARKKWLTFTKKRKPSKALIKQQKRVQLNYVKRNLKHIDKLLQLGIKAGRRLDLPEQLRQKMYVISELYRQQKIMYDDGRKKISNRIVSIAQPHVRPIVRGKAGTPVEFGAKLNISLTEGYVNVDQASFDAFHEGKGLIELIEAYKSRFGYYPQYALVDKIYLTRENRKFMKDQGIQHTGVPLGRPKPKDQNQKRKHNKKAAERNHIEGKIGQAKRKYGLNLLKTKLKETSLCAIQLIALSINMASLLQKAFYAQILAVVTLILKPQYLPIPVTLKSR